MADDHDAESESSRVFDYKSLFDHTTSKILTKLDCTRRCDVADELVEALSMAMLMDARLKVFRFAKKKLLKSVRQADNVDLEPTFRGSLPKASLRDAEKVIEQWGMITRKGKPRVALDLIELLSYVSGDDPFFPHRLLKKRQKKGNYKFARVNNKPKRQGTITFKPVRNAETSDEDDGGVSDTSQHIDPVPDPNDDDNLSDNSLDMFDGVQQAETLDSVEVAVDDVHSDSEASEVVCEIRDTEIGNSILDIPATSQTSKQTEPLETLADIAKKLAEAAAESDSESDRESQADPLETSEANEKAIVSGEVYEIPADSQQHTDNKGLASIATGGDEPLVIAVRPNLSRSQLVAVDIPPLGDCLSLNSPASKHSNFFRRGKSESFPCKPECGGHGYPDGVGHMGIPGFLSSEYIYKTFFV